MKQRPLILVVDLDNTLIVFDEEGYSSSSAVGKHNLFVRKDANRFLRLIKNLFDDNVFVVLWSAGENLYVQHVLHILNIYDFNLVLGRKETDESLSTFDVCKSPKYLLERSDIRKWILKKVKSGLSDIPALAIIDDKALDNTSEYDCYHFTFTPTPLLLNNIYYSTSQHSLICKDVKPLHSFAFYLYVELVEKLNAKIIIGTSAKYFAYKTLTIS